MVPITELIEFVAPKTPPIIGAKTGPILPMDDGGKLAEHPGV
jgi:hypothetical protein